MTLATESGLFPEAGYRIRTDDIQLGKVTPCPAESGKARGSAGCAGPREPSRALAGVGHGVRPGDRRHEQHGPSCGW